MKVLVVHESYQQPGGEDRAVDADVDILRFHGHEVLEYRRDNLEVGSHGPVRLGLTTIWSHSSYHELTRLVTEERPDIVHFHNTLPLISPSGLWAARRGGSRVVQTLHNYRLLCPNALLFRNGAACEECLGWPVPLPGILHGCYRESRPATAAIATMLAFHRLVGTWDRSVDGFIALTEFQKSKLASGGLPARRISIRPNFVEPDPGLGPGDGGYALFVGRLSAEKGILTLLGAWQHLDVHAPLLLVGDGPLASAAGSAATKNKAISYLGPQTNDRVLELMRRAAILVFPSLSYEGCPITIIEAFATGLPVVAAGTWTASKMVKDGDTGLLVPPGDPHALAGAVSRLFHDDALRRRMRVACRREYLEEYTGERAYARLMNVYERALNARPRKLRS